VNPYEPPSIPAEVLEPQWPAGGAYSDGSYLVLHHASTLPPICVKTGRPAETEQDYELVGGINDGSVPESQLRWYGEKVYTIRLPLSQVAVSRARWMHVFGVGLAIAMLAGLFVLAWMYSIMRSPFWAEGWLGAGLIGLIVSVAFLTEARHQLQLECVARGYFWISKAPRKYLRQLPEWPVPQPSFWRRAFFGPAGVSTTNSAAVPAESPPT
jgi:hypothetical protein